MTHLLILNTFKGAGSCCHKEKIFLVLLGVFYVRAVLAERGKSIGNVVFPYSQVKYCCQRKEKTSPGQIESNIVILFSREIQYLLLYLSSNEEEELRIKDSRDHSSPSSQSKTYQNN